MEFIPRGIEPAQWKVLPDRMRPWWGGTQQTEGKRMRPARPFGPMAVRKRFDRLFTKEGEPIPRYALEGLGQGSGRVVSIPIPVRTKIAEATRKVIQDLANKRMRVVAGRSPGDLAGLGALGADLNKFSSADIALVMNAMNVARWELERAWTDTLLRLKIDEIKAGEAVVRFDKPLSVTPEEAASAAFKEGVVADVADIGRTAADIAKKTVAKAVGLVKFLPWIVIGIGGLVAVSYIAPLMRRRSKA